ncbi:F0F1 ATP synthase subunit delta [Spiroplasma helicoides]|uniref:ATP synthase subunit delta n=1 Tax=Spiroplasma helicoides TaxID=216938 RepID=A0A1B3SJC6_9MOLU|nr:F0F1 ATP synthase subunit delta [Spiroplasma helicoides]AOG60020.1 F0F1 ATP synthase subunit delta [Spiroplasma helicoides]
MFAKQSLIKNWSSAITTIATENKKVEEFLSTARDLNALFLKDHEIIDFFSNRSIDLQDRIKMLDKAFASKIDVNLLNTLKLLICRNLFQATIDIFRQVITDLLKVSDSLYGTVYSISPLDSATIKKIESKLSNKTNKKVILENVIREELIAGILVEIDGKRFDSSVQGKMLDMRRKVIINRK